MEEGEAFIQLNDVGRVFVTRCIQLIESKGVDNHEGLYRLVGSSARVKKSVALLLLLKNFAVALWASTEKTRLNSHLITHFPISERVSK